MSWFEKEVYGRSLIKFILLLVAVSVLWSYTTGYVLLTYKVGLLSLNTGKFREYIFLMLLLVLLYSAFIEECMFRLPLSFVSLFKKEMPYVVIALAVVSSVAFGYVHGGIGHILIQGVDGFLFAVVYIKAGGMRGAVLKPLTASTSTHFLYNMSLILLLRF